MRFRVLRHHHGVMIRASEPEQRPVYFCCFDTHLLRIAGYRAFIRRDLRWQLNEHLRQAALAD